MASSPPQKHIYLPNPTPSTAPAPAVKNKTEELDRPLSLFGFEFHELSSELVTGQLLVTPKCCLQPLGVLHGGIAAVIAEALASLGATIAGGVKKCAGVHLSINHHGCSAELGEVVTAQAKPISITDALQVWEVLLWKTTNYKKHGNGNKVLISSSKVTVYCTLQNSTQNNNIPKDAFTGLIKYAKL